MAIFLDIQKVHTGGKKWDGSPCHCCWWTKEDKPNCNCIKLTRSFIDKIHTWSICYRDNTCYDTEWQKILHQEVSCHNADRGCKWYDINIWWIDCLKIVKFAWASTQLLIFPAVECQEHQMSNFLAIKLKLDGEMIENCRQALYEGLPDDSEGQKGDLR